MYNPLSGRETTFRRLIGHYSQQRPGPTLFVLAGLHGNEPSGVLGCEAVLTRLKHEQIPFAGQVVCLAGNLTALHAGVRFADRDLNRMFGRDEIERIQSITSPVEAEEQELIELTSAIDEFVDSTSRCYFLDCHSTSGESIPFISCLRHQDSLELTRRMPVHTVINESDELCGVSDTYLTSRGYTGFTFEAGQHSALATLEYQSCMIWALLQEIGCIEQAPHPVWERLQRTQTDGRWRLGIDYIHHVGPNSGFRMAPGFVNFQRIRAGELLAWEYDQPIHSRWNARIYMPLYQSLGSEGFYIVSER